MRPVSVALTSAAGTMRVGSPVTIEALLTGPGSTFVLQATIVVGKRESSPDVTRTRDAALRPENHMAERTEVVNAIAHGQRVSVTFTPAAPGTYPVYFLARIRCSDDSARDESDLRPRDSHQVLSHVIVR